MLRHEDAARILAGECTTHWQKVCLEAIAALPAALRPTAYALLGRDAVGVPLQSGSQEANQRRERVQAEGYARLGDLPPDQRLAIFATLFPAAAPAVEAGWRLMARQPYQVGWQRKAFRLRDATGVTPAQRMWLSQLVHVLGEYRDKDITWLAAWAPYLGYGHNAQPLGVLCAATIDAGGAQGEQVFETLVASARGEHPIGAMGRHVTTGLLAAARPDGWDFVERLLLAAQREEGLRQVILETVDEAHPCAFRRMLRLILDHDLIRFSATVRAVDVWFGFNWDVDHTRAVRDSLATLSRFLDDPAARRAALDTPEPPAAYLAWWATAFEDAGDAITQAEALPREPEAERRLLAAYLLGQLGLATAQEQLLPLLDDPDPRVALRAFAGIAARAGSFGEAEPPADGDLFERLERLLGRLDDSTKTARQEDIAWPWQTPGADAGMVASALLGRLGARSPKRLIPYMTRMHDYDRMRVATMLAALPEWDTDVHDTIFALVRDRSSWVRAGILNIIAARPLAPADAPTLEALLTRKSSDARRGALTLLLKQDDDEALGSAERLLAARHPLQRLAGLDLLQELAGEGRRPTQCRARAERYRAARDGAGLLTSDEAARLDAMLESAPDAGAGAGARQRIGVDRARRPRHARPAATAARRDRHPGRPRRAHAAGRVGRGEPRNAHHRQDVARRRGDAPGQRRLEFPHARVRRRRRGWRPRQPAAGRGVAALGGRAAGGGARRRRVGAGPGLDAGAWNASRQRPHGHARRRGRHRRKRPARPSSTFPGPEDTAAEFARLVGAAGVDTERLVAAAVYAPQWARRVEDYLAWPALEEAVWWTHTHTKDTNWSVDAGLKEVWQAEMSERTPLSAQDLLDSAVDVEWFWRSYRGLGAARWEQVYAAAKYASSGTGHARARLFADAMTGKVTAIELGQRITVKRAQDAVRALGLVPLPDARGRDEEVGARYNAIQEFVRSGKKFGAGRRASEEAAARISLENLARTAGYADPARLQWAMEARLAADLREGAIQVSEGDIDVTLALDALTAEPRITVTKAGGRALKTLPSRLKKSPDIVALLARKVEIERQVARMRLSLEAAMCRGDRFEVAELARLLDHPVLARLLRNLVFVRDSGDSGAGVTPLGYPSLAAGAAGAGPVRFTAYEGAVTVVDAGVGDLRLAHPYDLFEGGHWHDWQHDCFAGERIQPFKQVFRELYVVTANERRNGDDAVSGRYSGQQVQPRQAMALLGARGWVAHPDEGARRTFHAEGLSAALTFDVGFATPAEVEGLTVDEVRFTRRGEWKPIPLTDVPPRVFSEVMRDLDLVVSVAHRGGVDPEATASTVEMRAALVRETSALLGLDNVGVKSAHALVKGGLGDYSIHLGSAIVHRQPGGALCIVPVHSQHRGRLFLPFSDNDPRTAEVVSKVVLLARDKDIKDPSILEQIL